jgi:molybdate transport system regulatory protein
MVKKGTSRKGVAAWQARPRWRITRDGRIALGPGKADLLQAIDRTRAISRAAAELEMSYRRAWMLVAEMNASFREPLVETSRWRGAGAALTPAGKRTLHLYRQLESRSATVARLPLLELRKLLRK